MRFGGWRNIAVTLIDGVVSEIGSAGICKRPDFSGVGPATAKQLAVAGGNVEPAFDAGFQAPGSPVWDSPRLTWRVIFTANLPILPIFGEKRPSGTPQEQNVISQKRVDWPPFLQIVVQSVKSL